MRFQFPVAHKFRKKKQPETSVLVLNIFWLPF